MTDLSLTTDDAARLDVDALAVGVLAGADGGLRLAPGAESVDRAMDGRLLDALRVLGARGEAGEVTRVPTLGATTAPTVVAVGLGTDEPTAEDLRRGAGAAVRALAGTRSVALTLALAGAGAEAAAAVAEGALFGAYSFLRYRRASEDARRRPVERVTVVAAADDDATRAAVQRAQALAAAVHLCRDLVNTPPGDLHPADLAQAAVDACTPLGLDVEVLDEEALTAGGFGGILGVGAGSTNPPRLVRIAFRHPEATTSVALVGKGITFDSGGLSLKPANAMEAMKSDMGGAAAVLSAMTAVARLEPKVNVTGWVPTAENMPSGTAIRPSDVLTIRGGKTVEVLNTDAEGRLILADAITRACEESPDVLVDAATLTGAQMVALGSHVFAVMANDDDLRSQVLAAAERTGEQAWPMPLPPELRKSLDSEIADIANMGERYGGMLVAGVFLEEFVADGVRWAHLDIAGPAFHQGEPYGYTPKGGTGAAVRTMVALVEDLASA